ncbi:protein ECERIFERUM 26-like [Lathyrus oleraceus]|uniref:Protein ECERIFERUM 26-like n=1 Tax=Pisum sativum TaxID=3888 RepID=A0A9D4ZWH3_PEA|nr:protein ECERIFERUM 26-like [Pisum sativum]KAI5385088.1 hypothetical protein KIW84_071908 [Pisum sativum]
MVFTQDEQESLIYDVRLSSVGPGRGSGSNIFHHPVGLDLAMKLHYLKVVYLFDSEAAQGLNIAKIKETLFNMFNHYFVPCGRFRRTESGRLFIKCNDCGARLAETRCTKTLDEWVDMKDWSSYKLLVSQQALGPELSFSPPVFLQVTQFKCGGAAIGISWAHVLGDPHSASDFMNKWGEFCNNLNVKTPYNIPRSIATPLNLEGLEKDPATVKRVDPVGDHWILANNKKMEQFSFHITASQMNNLQEQIWGSSVEKNPSFESLCAIIWRCIARVREGSEPTIVTVCRSDPNGRGNDMIGNDQLICKVDAGNDCSIVDTDLKTLARLLVEQGTDERKQIEEIVETNEGVADFFVYGANLTFLNLEDVNVHDFKLRGKKPIFVYYTLQGVGDEGAVLVLPWSKDPNKNDIDGKFVTIIFPEDEMVKIKDELKMNGVMVDGDF